MRRSPQPVAAGLVCGFAPQCASTLVVCGGKPTAGKWPVLMFAYHAGASLRRRHFVVYQTATYLEAEAMA